MNIINNLFFINIYIASIFVFLSCTYNIDRSKDQNQKFSLFVENFNNKENNYSNSLNRLNEKNILDELNQVKKELNNLRSINIDSLVGRLLYLCKNFSISINKIFSSLLEK